MASSPAAGPSSGASTAVSGRLLRVLPTKVEVPASESHLRDIPLRPSPTSSRSTWTIGRNPLAEVPIASVKVSRKHAALTFDAPSSRWNVEDLRSTNGVRVNDDAVDLEAGAEIKHGDTVSLGPLDDYKWKFVVLGSSRSRKRPEINEVDEKEPPVKRPKVQESEAEGINVEHSSNPISEVSRSQPSQASTVLDEEKPADSKASDAGAVADRLRERFAAELCCPVCSEVFISPQTLSACGHVFCSLCLAKWKKKKRYDTTFCCPSCRVGIKKKDIMPNIYLKNLVDSWQETLGEEMLKERKQALADREEQEAELRKEEEERERLRELHGGARGRGKRRGGGRAAGAAAAAGNARGDGTGGSGGGGASLVQPSIMSAMAAAAAAPEAIQLSSDTSDHDDDDEDENDDG